MEIGDWAAVDGCRDVYYVDAGLYDTPRFGAVYVVDADRPAVIDTGIGKHWEAILAGIEDIGIDRTDVGVIAPTHVHLDHAGGTGYLAAECPQAEVVTHERGIRHLADPSDLWAATEQAVGDKLDYYLEPQPVAEDRLRGLTDGDVLDLGSRTLDVVHAPGHASHQVVFHDPDDAVVFAADAAGMYIPSEDVVKPTTPPAEFDPDQAIEDIRRIADLEPDTLCYGHYGPAPTADRLEAAERVLREWVDRVRSLRAELDDDRAVLETIVEAEGERWADADSPLLSSGIEVDVYGILGYLDRQADSE